MNKLHQKTIKVCDCQILAHHKFKGDQYILLLASNIIANETKPGQFLHITVSNSLLMRRPISIMSVNVENGTFELLYKITGEGTRQLSKRRVGEVLSVIGPIGNGFKITEKKMPLLLGGGVGMPPIIAIAQKIKKTDYKPLVVLGSEVPFPFIPKLRKIDKSCSKASHTMPLLETWGVVCQLASMQDYKGVFKGYVTDLARMHLEKLKQKELKQVEIYACGPHPMLKAVAKLAAEYELPCQVSLEEYMACGVGGCAGCAVAVESQQGLTMKRVCVDGPVFDAKTVF